MLFTVFNYQKQPTRGVPRKRCSENMQQITLRDGCSPVNLLHIFRTPFLKNTSGRLLLNYEIQPITEAKLETETHIVTTESKINKC